MDQNQYNCDSLSNGIGYTEPDAALKQMYFSANRAKLLGRTAFHADTGTLWCSQSASGIAFGFRGRACILRFKADSAIRFRNTAVRYAVYLNDELVTDALLTKPEQSLVIKHPDDTASIAWVRLVKLSESELSSIGIREICITFSQDEIPLEQTDLLIPAGNKCRLIEFIGDSITCGYGIDGQCGDIFSTATENAEKAFAYLTAKQFDADYSMVCHSGYGIISGYTADGTKDTAHILPPFYSQAGHSLAKIENTRRIDDDLWDFSAQPDLIVINLGTNDASYTGTDADKQNAFAEGYRAFLYTVRRMNPHSPILCTLGIMGHTLYDAVESAVSEYSEESGDHNIRTMRFDMQSAADGMAVDFHPSALTHEKAAARLCDEIHTWLGW